MFGASFLTVVLILWAAVTIGFIGVMIWRSLIGLREVTVCGYLLPQPLAKQQVWNWCVPARSNGRLFDFLAERHSPLEMAERDLPSASYR